MEKKTLELDVKTKKAESSIGSVVEAIEKLTEKLTESKGEAEGVGNALDKPAKKGIFKRLGGGIKGIAKGFGGLTKAAGIFGLITLAVGKLVDLLKGSQVVVDAFAVGFEFIEQIFSALSKALTSVYESVSQNTENFDALGKVLNGILTITLTPMKLAWEAIQAGIVGAQLAWEKSYFGDGDPQRIAELEAELDQIGQNFIDIGKDVVQAGADIVNNFTEAVTETVQIGSQVIDEVSKINVKAIFDQSKANVEFEKQAKISAARNAGIVAEYERQAEVQRQVRDNTELDLKTRAEANDKIKGIYAEQKRLLLENAQIQIDLAQGEVDKAEDNVEAQVALIQAQNEYKAVLEQVNSKMSEFKTNETTLRRENLDLINSETEAENQRTIANGRAEADMVDNAMGRLLAHQAIDAQEAEMERTRLEEKVSMFKVGTQARQDAENELQTHLSETEIQAESRRKEINDQRIADEQAVQDAKFALASSALGSLQGLTDLYAKKGEKQAKKAFAVNKALSMVQVGLNTAQAIMKVAAETTDVTPVQAFRTANMIAMGVAGAVQIATIAATKYKSSAPTKAPTGNMGGGGGAQASATPNFNVVGQSGTNQIAEAIGQQPPIQTYVVAGDVTTAQQLENNTIQQATF